MANIGSNHLTPGGNSRNGIFEALHSVALFSMHLPCDSSVEKAVKPVPAPRPSRAISQKLDVQLPQSRSCSVPPNSRGWWQQFGRELNVDDGLSVRSGSVASLVSYQYP